MDLVNSIHKLFLFDGNNPISSTGGSFLLFFALFIAVYAFVYKMRLVRTVYIIAFSFFIYYYLTGWLLLVMVFTLCFDYFNSVFIHASINPRRKRLLLLLSIIVDIGLLAYFKYTNFFIGAYSAIAGHDFVALNIIMPLGISFYTFRSISYIIDVYRGDMKPARHLMDYAFYMSFFPLLVSGPITRAKAFLPQVRKRFNLKDDKVNKALFLILIGLVKKAVIADYIGQYCNLVFDMPASYSGFENLAAVYGFAVQIYFDFSGYTDMAIGLALLLGFNIGINFNKPYHALNITDFWRRWHISLSSWLRDYLFSPLSLSLREWGKAGMAFAIFLTFVLCGLWHGANWTFMFWGACYGGAMAFEALTAKLRKRLKKRSNHKLYTALSWLLTFHFVTVLWIFFRCANMETAFAMLGKIFTDMDWAYLPPFLTVRLLWALMMFAAVLFYIIPAGWYPLITERFSRLPFLLKVLVFLAIVQLVVQFRSADVQPFLYAQF